MAKKNNASAREVVDQLEAEAVQQITEIDPLLLKDEFTKISGHLARYNELYANSLRRHLKAERHKKETYARLYVEKRETAEEKLTEGMIKAMVEMDEEYEQACALAIDAEVEKTRAWGRCEAVRAKKDALISLGAHVRAELSGDPKLRDYQQAMNAQDD